MAIALTNPIYLWLLLAIPFFLFAHLSSLSFMKKRAMRLANFEALERVQGKTRFSMHSLLILLRLFTIALLVFSAAGLVFWYEGKASDTTYVIAIDVSGSMLASDIAPNRLEAAKEGALVFVDSLTGVAALGVVSFSGIEKIEIPLTSTKSEVKDAISSIEVHALHGTAIGSALRSSLSLLYGVEKARAVILLTDGQENVAPINQLYVLAKEAASEHVIVHTIALGTMEGGALPGLEVESKRDDTALKQIALISGGQFYAVENSTDLQRVYRDLAKSSDAQIPVDLRMPLLVLGIILLFVEWTLVSTVYRSVP